MSQWKSARDSQTNKVYYYNVATRQSQWDKPLELCTPAERDEVLEKERRQKAFFEEMESNIRRRLQQGRAIADIDDSPKRAPREADGESSPPAGMRRNARAATAPNSRWRELTGTAKDDVIHPEPKEMVGVHGTASEKPGRLCRTISTMDPLLLLRELHADNEEEEKQSPAVIPVGGDAPSFPPLPPIGQVSVSGGEGEEGRKLLLRPSSDILQGARGNNKQFGDFTGELHSSQQEKYPDRGSARGVSRRNSTSTLFLQQHDTMSDPDRDATIRCVCALFRAHLNEAVGLPERGKGYAVFEDRVLPVPPSPFFLPAASAEAASGQGGAPEGSVGCVEQQQQQVRGRAANMNTAAPFFPQSKSSADRRVSFSDRVVELAASEEGERRASASGPGERASGQGEEIGEIPSGGKMDEVPSLPEITDYFRNIFYGSSLPLDCIILSLIYIERLIKETGGDVRPNPRNWKSLLLSALILSSKVWDDNSMWNADFVSICPFSSLARVNELEVALLEALKFNVKVEASNYAKYYFLLRSMCARSGLGKSSALPLDVNGARKLEALSSQLQTTSLHSLLRLKKSTTLHVVEDRRYLERVGRSGYKFVEKAPIAASIEEVVHGMERVEADGKRGRGQRRERS